MPFSNPVDEAWRTLWGHEEPYPSSANGSRPAAAPQASDAEAIRRLFGRAPARRAAEETRSERWPKHNYNRVYTEEARRQRRMRRATDALADDVLGIWEVDDAFSVAPVPTGPAPSASPPPRPYPSPVAVDTPAAWLDQLMRNAAVPEATEAQLVRARSGEARRVTAPVFDVTDVIAARPRESRRGHGAHIVVRAPPATTSRRGLRALFVAASALVLGLGAGAVVTLILLV